ncbi:hypothetical protein J3R82DRAFT_1269 [Butyriboletus roseoflavus]|nr:hypothetical protein J3R82DRAFT_1269 [Butyriboletus roseoflavus]
MTQDDAVSTFSYDGEADPDTFSLHRLGVTVCAHFGTACELKRLGEGGYHKVDIRCMKFYRKMEHRFKGVVRVAAPAFPKDKLESEVGEISFADPATSLLTSHCTCCTNTDTCSPGLHVGFGCI